MNSFFAKMYLDLQAEIAAHVTEIRFVEQNFGQYLQDDYRAKVSFPTALIDFTNTGYSGLQGDNQLANATINIVLLFAPYSQSYNLAPADVKEKALNYYEIEHKLCKVLQAWKTDYCTQLVRTDAKSQNNNDIGLRIRELNFTTEFEDYSNDDEDLQQFTDFSFTGAIDRNIV